jgi:hypothetical protein
MHGVEKGLTEFGGMLKIAECDIKKCAWHSHVMEPTFKKKGASCWKKSGKAKYIIHKPKPAPKQKVRH